LRRIASTLGWDHKPLLQPHGQIDVTYDEFSEVVQMLDKEGFRSDTDVAEAWSQFVAWRFNHESVAYHLAERVVAPPSPWSGSRLHLPGIAPPPRQPPHRDSQGRVILMGVDRFTAGRSSRRRRDQAV
jgi:hypothetical protein